MAALDSVTVQAYGTSAEGKYAHFYVTVDGKQIGAATTTKDSKLYSFAYKLEPNKPHDIKVHFDNDHYINGQDRNLFVSAIKVNNTTIASNNPLVKYDIFNGKQMPGQVAMPWNGSLDFNLASKYFQVAPNQPQTTFYVAKNGVDTNDGSIDRPFATIEQALKATAAPTKDTIILRDGLYNLSSTLKLGADQAGTTIKANAGEHPVLDGSAAHLGTLLLADGVQNLTIKGLTFSNGGSSDWAVVLNNASQSSIVANHFVDNGTALRLINSSDNKVSGNRFDKSGKSAIEVQDGSNRNLIDSNTIDGTGADATQGGGVFMHGVHDNTISHNVIKNTAGMGIGVENWDTYTINTGNKISYNILENTNQSSFDSGSIYALGRSHVDTEMTISYNLIRNSGSADSHTVGIYLDDSTTGAEVYGNILTKLGTHGVQIHGGDDNLISNNVMDLGSGRTSAVLFQSAPSDTNPKNTQLNNVVTKNIIYSSSNSPIVYDHIDGGKPIIKQNLYYNTSGASMKTYAPTADSQPIFGNPQFANPAAGDYKLAASSPAYALGFTSIPVHLIGIDPAAETWN